VEVAEVVAERAADAGLTTRSLAGPDGVVAAPVRPPRRP
jgi:hypothetical protein